MQTGSSCDGEGRRAMCQLATPCHVMWDLSDNSGNNVSFCFLLNPRKKDILNYSILLWPLSLTGVEHPQH